MTEKSNYEIVFGLQKEKLARAEKQKFKRKVLKGVILSAVVAAGIGGCIAYNQIRDYQTRQEQQRAEFVKEPLRGIITMGRGTNSITAYAYNNGEKTNYLVKRQNE